MSLTRREFVGTALSAAGVVAGAPALLRGQNLNNKLNLAIIGAGGRGAANLKGLLSENIVVLCDVSGSVANFASFTLLLVYALREQFAKVRAFTFVDDVHEVTAQFRPGADPVETLARLSESARHASRWGRTDYGRAFRTFQERHADAIGPKTACSSSATRARMSPVIEELAGRTSRDSGSDGSRPSSPPPGSTESTRWPT